MNKYNRLKPQKVAKTQSSGLYGFEIIDALYFNQSKEKTVEVAETLEHQVQHAVVKEEPVAKKGHTKAIKQTPTKPFQNEQRKYNDLTKVNLKNEKQKVLEDAIQHSKVIQNYGHRDSIEKLENDFNQKK